MNLSRSYLISLGSLATGAFMLSGCLFGGNNDDPTVSVDHPVHITACADLTPVQKATADSLVLLANAKMTADMEYMFSDTVSEWKDIHDRSPQAALSLYNQALAAAPGHCGATFGRAVASTMMTTQDPKFDAFITKAEQSNLDTKNPAANKVSSGMGLLKLSPDQAAPVLLKLSADMQQIDFPTVTEFQSLVESVLMPKVDSAIASLEEALKFENFTFEFDTQERGVIQLDHGEIGPLLAGLKVVKAWLTVAGGYQWELAINGKYHWMDSLQIRDDSDFDHLRPGQIAALDQITGLFKTTSPFSRMKPAWQTRINGIPALLLSAVENAQKGLTYAINEAKKPTGQENDLYVVGTGPDADVDPADLQDAVDILERAKKYLRGEVNLTYNNGRNNLKVNFPKVFTIDGIQSKFPYFQIRPYTEWNDTISADTIWSSYSYLGSSTRDEMLSKTGYDSKYDRSIYFSSTESNGIVQSYEIKVEKDYDPTNPGQYETQVLATFTPVIGQPCSFNFEKAYDRVLKPGAVLEPFDTYDSTVIAVGSFPYTSPYSSVAKITKGTIKINSCRVGPEGPEFVEYVDAITKGPVFFTNPSGSYTIDVADLNKYSDSLPSLANKVYFRDPTFGGVFPELTQANIWTVIKSLSTVKARPRRVCEEVLDVNGYFDYVCQDRKLKDLSDLDLLNSILDPIGTPL